MSAFARARRIVAVAACGAAALAAAGSAGAQAMPRGAPESIAQMSAAQAREFALGEIRTLVAIARAGSQHADAPCRAAAARAAHLAGNGIDAVVQADKARDRELRKVGTGSAEDPAIQDHYRRAANATLEARQSVAGNVAGCPDLVAARR